VEANGIIAPMSPISLTPGPMQAESASAAVSAKARREARQAHSPTAHDAAFIQSTI
jgi:hypothetical protein